MIDKSVCIAVLPFYPILQFELVFWHLNLCMQAFIDRVIPFIISQQESTGGFPTWESYPVVNPAAGWTHLPDPSPFITANILFALIQVNDLRLNDVIARGAKSLLSSKEGKGFWRFWPVKSKQHPLPLDMDDTCIALSVLERCGYHFNNRNILLNNQNTDGYFETWLRPRLSTLFLSPLVTFDFFNDYLLARPTHKLGYFAYSDHEPAIAANALLYLGENGKTNSCIKQIIREVRSGDMPKKFYDDEVVIYYHISRAFANGIQSFIELGPVMAERICNRFKKNMACKNELMCAMAANVLLDHGLEIDFAEQLLNHIAGSDCFPDQWITDAYFCSNDKNFLAGSPALTASVFVEGCAKLNRHKSI